MKKLIITTMLVSILTLCCSNCVAVLQNNNQTISNVEKEQVIDSVAKFMTDYYVFLEIGKQIAGIIKEKHNDGRYKSAKTYVEFSALLNEDLRQTNNDRHIVLRYEPEEIKRGKELEKENENGINEEFQLEMLKKDNFGFKELKILQGNIGYVKLDAFNGAEVAGKTAVAAMNYISNTDAIIFDLTDNGGGQTSMIQLISSYFFNEPVHLNTFYYRDGNITKQFWTQANVQGSKMVNKDIYVLTSRRTFSAAEEFAYNLKCLNRATIVGEITAGGAHPAKTYRVNDNFSLQIPYGRAVNPLTKTNWEGTGVKPNFEVSSTGALNTALLLALEKLELQEDRESFKQRYFWAIDGLKAKLNPVIVDERILKTYAGEYGPRNILFENGELLYQRENGPKFRLIPISDDYFYFEEKDNFRIKFIKKNSVVVSLEGHYDDGRADSNLKAQSQK